MSIELVIPSSHFILCHPLLLSSIFPSIRVFSNESVLCIRWPKYWSFSFSINPSNEYSGLISFRIDWASLIAQLVKNPPAMQETLVLFLGLSGRSPGEGKGYPFQYSGLKNSMDCSTPGFPVHHYLSEFAQTHVHWVGDTIQPSCPLLAPRALNLSQHQDILQRVSFSHQVAKVLELQL